MTTQDSIPGYATGGINNMALIDNLKEFRKTVEPCDCNRSYCQFISFEDYGDTLNSYTKKYLREILKECERVSLKIKKTLGSK